MIRMLTKEEIESARRIAESESTKFIEEMVELFENMLKKETNPLVRSAASKSLEIYKMALKIRKSRSLERWL